MPARYAIYYAPEPESALWRFGSAVLGYDAATGAEVPAFVPPGFAPADWAALTADPRLYGFHATLKAPFRLAGGEDEDSLRTALGRFAAATAPVPLGRCAVHPVPGSTRAGAFLAITPVASPPALALLEAAVVTQFERFRAPLTPDEVARRHPDRLTPRQRDNLARYGYPLVLEDFRFHMTLTGLLPDAGPISAILNSAASDAGVPETIALDRLALFRQDGPAGGVDRFRIVAAFALSGTG